MAKAKKGGTSRRAGKAPPGQGKAGEKKPRQSESRLDLLRKKLELEQAMLEKKSSGGKKELAKAEKEYEEASEEEDAESEERAKGARERLKEGEEEEPQEFSPTVRRDDDEEQEIEKVADLIEKSRKKGDTEKTAGLTSTEKKSLQKAVLAYKKIFDAVKREVGKVVVGQDIAVMGLLRALIADGHVLVEGVPGIAKTTLIRALAKTTQCSFSRIQFTPDLLPTDIIGISTYQEGRGFYTLKGPIFNNFILADEINRAPPKVQSALLESMAEKQATIAKESFPVPLPFFTMATQNPLESVGTYALPEAQVDRFMFKIYMGYPSVEEEERILRTNINEKAFDAYDIRPILSPDLIIQIQERAKTIYVDKKVEKYIVKLVDATRNPKKYNVASGKYVEFGASPRGSINIFKAAKAEAMLQGQGYVTPHHVKTVAHDVLRHRIILTYEGQAEGLRSEQVIDEILKKVPVP